MKKLSITILPEEMSCFYGSNTGCPLAVAIRRQLEAKTVYVGSPTVYINNIEYTFDPDKWGMDVREKCQKENKCMVVRLKQV